MEYKQRRAVFYLNKHLGCYNYALLTPGAGHGFGQHRVDFIQYLALVGTLGEGLLIDTFFAGAFDQIADFEVVFKFEYFFCHFIYISVCCVQKSMPF